MGSRYIVDVCCVPSTLALVGILVLISDQRVLTIGWTELIVIERAN